MWLEQLPRTLDEKDYSYTLFIWWQEVVPYEGSFVGLVATTNKYSVSRRRRRKSGKTLHPVELRLFDLHLPQSACFRLPSIDQCHTSSMTPYLHIQVELAELHKSKNSV